MATSLATLVRHIVTECWHAVPQESYAKLPNLGLLRGYKFGNKGLL
jgi:hypothetical protein